MRLLKSTAPPLLIAFGFHRLVFKPLATRVFSSQNAMCESSQNMIFDKDSWALAWLCPISDATFARQGSLLSKELQAACARRP